MKAIQINNEIKVFGQLPKTWNNILNFRMADEALQKEQGFYDVLQPEHNTELQRLGEIYFDANCGVFTYPVIDIPQEELEQRKEQELSMIDARFDQQAAKRLLRKVAEPLFANELSLTQQDIDDAKMLYSQFRVGVIYDKDSTDIDEKRFVWNGDLYKVIGAKHTSQADWTPDVAVSLYVKITPPGVIAEWVRPTHAENAYQTGDKVTWEGETWESEVDNNSWEPGVYGWRMSQ